MATQSREPAADLKDQDGKFDAIRAMLEREPYSFRFFQAVRLLERLYPERNPVGLFVSPASEAVAFSSVPSLSFPASEIQELRMEKDGQPKLFVNFMGLSAGTGALPHPYTEYLLESIRAIKTAGGVTIVEDPTYAEFADMPIASERTGCVDFVLPLNQISKQLVGICALTA